MADPDKVGVGDQETLLSPEVKIEKARANKSLLVNYSNRADIIISGGLKSPKISLGAKIVIYNPMIL